MTDPSEKRWQYKYTVSNDTLASNIEELMLKFPVAMYGNLVCETDPPRWKSIISYENAGLRIINYKLMRLLTVKGLPQANCRVVSQSGFMVALTGLPRELSGNIFLKSSIRTKNFEAISSGWTIHLRADSGVTPGPASIPNPCTFVLFGCGLGRIVCSATIHE